MKGGLRGSTQAGIRLEFRDSFPHLATSKYSPYSSCAVSILRFHTTATH